MSVSGCSLLEAVQKTVNRLEGQFAIAAGSIFFIIYIKEATVIPIKAIPTELPAIK
jgi:hypothetical protein